jgi:HAD superfamily hydrolase (TIGR01490 family)
MTSTSQAAFFDVDGTLTTATSMFRFLEYRFAAEGRPAGAYHAERRRLREMTLAGVPRSETNREYFRSYAGLAETDVAGLAADWFRVELGLGGFFNPVAVDAFHRHAAAGERTVLVSGSFAACLDPIARHLGADVVLCSRPEISGGHYTGGIELPMIGDQKAVAVGKLGVDLSRSWAYGDHDSDLPLLEAVGTAVVVGDELAALALRRGWARLPGAARAPALPLPVARA